MDDQFPACRALVYSYIFIISIVTQPIIVCLRKKCKNILRSTVPLTCVIYWDDSINPTTTIGPFQIFWQIHIDICKPKCTTARFNDTGGNLPRVSTTPVANLPLLSTTPAVNFATGTASVVDTGGKFATGVNNTGAKLPLVSTTPVAKKWEQYQTADA
jgi:hypothetical protein